MSGHSKWSKIKHKKAANDAKKGKSWTKLLKEVEMTARDGGDPDMNFSLAAAIVKAKNGGVPKENIKRAVERGSGDADGGSKLESIIYEGYGPNGVGILVKCLTDNTKRTYPDIRTVFDKNGGNMAANGAVQFMFDEVGEIVCQLLGETPEEAELKIMETSATNYDFNEDEKKFLITTNPKELKQVSDKLKGLGFIVEDISLSFSAKTEAQVDDRTVERVEKLIEKLEELDDVNDVWSNLT